jgi:hypothetical protein
MVNRKGVDVWFRQGHDKIRYLQRDLKIYCLSVTSLGCPPRARGVVQSKVLGVANFVPNITHLVFWVSLLTHYRSNKVDIKHVSLVEVFVNFHDEKWPQTLTNSHSI